jgi:membrane protein
VFVKEVWEVVKQAASEWMEHKASTLGAALAFYSILSLAPLLVIAIAIAGFIFGEQAARGEIVEQIEGMVGQQGAEAIEIMLTHAHQPDVGITATVLGVLMMLLGAMGVFVQLRDALNTIWEIEPRSESGIRAFIRDRFFPFMLVLGTGFLLLVSLVLSAVISAMAEYAESWLPAAERVWHAVNFGASFVMVFLLFALIYKVLPAARVAWRDVWLGAAITAILFTVGKLLLAIYLAKSGIGSAYGAAGSLVVLLVWIYYAAQILFFGAELTQVFARRYGSRAIGQRGRVERPATAQRLGAH